MKQSNGLALAAAFLLASLFYVSAEQQFSEDFSSNPFGHGWQATGDTNLFQWDNSSGTLRITWDSSKPNSFFARPLGSTVTKADDFSLSFDLSLSDFQAGVDPAKPSVFQITVGLINLAEATQTNFVRGIFGSTPDLVEFSFFPDPGGSWQWGPSVTATLIDHTGFNWSDGGFAGVSLETGAVFHVSMTYTASSGVLQTSVQKNGSLFVALSDAKVKDTFQELRVDHVAVCSYSDAGQDPSFAGSILAHGSLDNLIVATPAPAVTYIANFGLPTGHVFVPNTLTNWAYVLERSSNLTSWSDAGTPVLSTGGNLTLKDPQPPQGSAFYRVRASRSGQ